MRCVRHHRHPDPLRYTAVDPSTVTVHPPCLSYDSDSPRVPSTPDNAIVASLPPLPVPPLHPVAAIALNRMVRVTLNTSLLPIATRSPVPLRPLPSRSRRVASQYKSLSRETLSSACSTSTEPESSPRAHRLSYPHKRCNASYSLQRNDGAALINMRSDFQCPVVGYDYIQKNHRVPDLKRHVMTHDRWIDPDRWTRCGVAMDRACFCGMGIEQWITDEECINAGACVQELIDDWRLYEIVCQEGRFEETCGQFQPFVRRAHGHVLPVGP